MLKEVDERIAIALTKPAILDSTFLQCPRLEVKLSCSAKRGERLSWKDLDFEIANPYKSGKRWADM
jgi:hypothetical protein